VPHRIFSAVHVPAEELFLPVAEVDATHPVPVADLRDQHDLDQVFPQNRPSFPREGILIGLFPAFRGQLWIPEIRVRFELRCPVSGDPENPVVTVVK